MRIRYKKKQVNLNLIFGLLWLVNGIIQTQFNENANWFDYFWFLISGIYLLIYFYQRNKEYLTIENGIIMQNWPLGKKMNLREITRIKHFAGEYTLISELKEMKINIDLIDKESHLKLKTELKKLSAEWT